MDTLSRVILATDELTLEETLTLSEKIGHRVLFKIHSLWDEHGPGVVEQLNKAGVKLVWVDLKLHDTPSTVRRRARAVRESGASFVSVHAAGEVEMMMAALETGIQVIAITVPTSLTEEQAHLLHGQPSKAGVLYLARLAKLAGVKNVVCSPKEVGLLAKRPELVGMNFITPGVRSAGVDHADQQRVDTPAAAIKAGAKWLVVGRQITQAKDPVSALRAIESEIEEALHAGGNPS
ncbi:orotidine-5'-phosphate decarboxylase [Candidatus Uhrbacteria bacterium]|nr:orotidine-5'-phosphate decarboxylase [Candidatus Uhrbacteria bacterium]